jgi:hypothetical protein
MGPYRSAKAIGPRPGLPADSTARAGARIRANAASFTASSLTDPTVPPVGDGFWYLSRDETFCDQGSYGHASDGTPRVTSACP